MNRRQRIAQIERHLGKRKLIWYGTRGTDAQVLLDLPQFSECFSLIAPLGAICLDIEVCLETLKGRRVDLDPYRIADDYSPEATEFKRRLFEALQEPAVVTTYRPDPAFTSLYYPCADFVEYLGLFHERQAPFEHKPWVETELRTWDVPTIPRRYLRQYDTGQLKELLEQGPVVARSTRSDGGEGLTLIQDAEEAKTRLPHYPDQFFSVAPYLVPNVPLNVNAVVFEDGTVSIHTPSLQLIGIPACTTRRFGYCGNDFARIRDLDVEVFDSLEDITRKTGKWLASMGYLGAFGIDALLHNGKVYMTEINARFQGSSHLSSLIDRDCDRPDMFLEHMAAFLGLRPPEPISMRELVVAQPGFSHAICHNCGTEPVARSAAAGADLRTTQLSLLPASTVLVDPEAILFRVMTQDAITLSGHSLQLPCDEQPLSLATDLFNMSPTFCRPEE